MKCLRSLTPGDLEWQLILLDNGKKLSPETIEFAKTLTPHFSLLQTDDILTPGKARNVALEAADREWVYFIDDDAYVKKGYWERVLPILEEKKIDVLGGPDSAAEGMNAIATSLSLALSSPFCTGATFARHKGQGHKLQIADEDKLTSCNLWIRRSILVGHDFPEDYKRAEEILFLQKLKKKGYGLFYHPLLVVGHHRRGHFKELIRPSFYAGFYRSRLMKEKLRKGNEAFWMPALFVLLHLLIFLDPVSFWYLARMYVSIILFVSIAISMQAKRASLFPVVAFLHYFIVFMFGIGFLSERLGLKRK